MPDAPGARAKRAAYTIRELCEAFGFSRAFFDRLMREDRGPRTMNLGGTVGISVRAADAFRRQAEKAPKAHRRGVAAQAARCKDKPAEG
jgi:predicted DNA-binding transcriptional regulator AlpA